jgi:hypothetical protein
VSIDNVLRQIRERDEMMRRLAEGPAAQYLREHQAAAEQLQEIARRFEAPYTAAAMQMQEFARRTEVLIGRLAQPEFVLAMERFVNQHREAQLAIERAFPQDRLNEFVRSVSASMEATRLAAASIDWDRFGSLVTVANQYRDVLVRVTERLTLRHVRLMSSLESAEGGLASAPPFVSELPTAGVFVHTNAVRSLTPHEILPAGDEQHSLKIRIEVSAETVLVIETTLPEMNPAYLNQYRGAKARISERGPDWWGQGGSSMRKLLKGVLHTAAPNEIVLPWAKQHKKELDRNDRPTRATKIEWLCQFIPNDAYRAYLRTELNSALALIELLDNTQHVDEFPEFEQQYEWIFLRLEVTVRHLLTLWKASLSH